MGLYKAINKFIPKQNCIVCTDIADCIICKSCENDFGEIKYSCKCCAVATTKTTNKCGNCLPNSPNFHNAFTIYEYDYVIAYLIKKMKYQSNLAIVRFFATKMAEKINTLKNSGIIYDALIPMPLHKNRIQERGYNQAIELLAKVDKSFTIDKTSITRIKATVALANLPLQERKKEIKNAFKINKTITKQKILIIDDVMSSCCSANELAKTIIKNNPAVKKCDVLTLARKSNMSL